MIIRVRYGNNEYDMVKSSFLDGLIRAGRVKMFLRAEGWVVVGRDPVRMRSEAYHGPDRREPHDDIRT